MTDKELKRLSRADLMELLLRQGRENQQLRQELEQAREELADRRIRLEEAGSIAQASLAIHGVMEAAQAAADDYVQAVEALHREQQEKCQRMEAETQEKCDQMLTQARENAQEYWEDTCERLRQLLGEEELQRRLAKLKADP